MDANLSLCHETALVADLAASTVVGCVLYSLNRLVFVSGLNYKQ